MDLYRADLGGLVAVLYGILLRPYWTGADNMLSLVLEKFGMTRSTAINVKDLLQPVVNLWTVGGVTAILVGRFLDEETRKTFKIYRHPTYGLEVVKRGASWPALFFGPFWMLAKKLWSFAGISFAAYIVLSLIEKVINQAPSEPGLQAIVYFTLRSEPVLQSIVYLMLAGGYLLTFLLPVFKGNTWRGDNLNKQGYELVDTLQSGTPDAAIAQVARTTEKKEEKK